MAYAQIEPFGEERSDIRSGVIASTIANVNRKKGKAPYKTKDFMPKFKQPKPVIRDISDDIIKVFTKLDKAMKAN